MQSSTPIVYVVDDDVAVRESLESLFSSMGWRSEMFETARAFLSRRRDPCPCCLVLDVRLPDLSGLELQRHVAGDRIAMPIIFITAFTDVPMTVRAMKAGAVEFLVKPFDAQNLLDAVRQAIALSRNALDHEESMRSLRERHASLSRREREVMALVTSGLLNKQIGGELGISEITVKAHRGSMMRKMGASSLADLVMMAGRLHIGPSGLSGPWGPSAKCRFPESVRRDDFFGKSGAGEAI
jgi:FixJ family two-component response regulator